MQNIRKPSRSGKKRVPLSPPFRFLGPVNVVSRIDQSFDLLDEITEKIGEVANAKASEQGLCHLLVNPNNICLAAYREGGEDRPRLLEGFVIAQDTQDGSKRITFLGMYLSDNIDLMKLFLDHLSLYTKRVLISADAKARTPLQCLGFVTLKRNGARYEMLRTFQ